MNDLIIKFTSFWTGRVSYLDRWYPMYFRLTRRRYMVARFDKVGADEAIERCVDHSKGYLVTVEKWETNEQGL